MRSLKNRFTEKIQKSSGCWTWVGAKDTSGYGRIYSKSGNLSAHRVSYALHFKNPGKQEVCHTCDNPGCVRPSHLFLGTHADNMADAKFKKRFPDRKGAKHPNAKLRNENVKTIRKLYAAGNTQRSIAKKYNVSHVLIGNIVRKKLWNHV